MSNSATERSLLEKLNAYVKHFETPNTREDLLAIYNKSLRPYGYCSSRPSSVNQLVLFMSLTRVYWAEKPFILPVK